MRVVKLAPLISRLGSLALASLLVLLAPRALSAGGVPELSLWLYAARVALAATLLIALPYGLLLELEWRLPRGRLLATTALLLGTLPLMWPLVEHLASGDGLKARGIPAPLVQALALFLLAANAAAIWTYRYWARARVLDVVLGGLFFSGLLACAALLRRAQLELSASLELSALVLGVLVLHAAWAERPRWLLGVGWGGVVLVSAIALAGFAAPEALARGRRLSLLTEASLGLWAAKLVPAPPEPALPARDATTCSRVLAPPHLPALPLPAEQRRNVIFISIDSVRADFVRRPRPDGTLAMPALAQFMDEARVGSPAYAAFPATLMSLASAFTGVAPSDLLLAPAPYPTLFQLTREHFDHREIILPGGRYFARPDVRAQLLEGVEVKSMGGVAHQSFYAKQLLRRLRDEGKSHFVWLHYIDPHEPYTKHPAQDFGDSDVARYTSELAHVDEVLGPLFELLRSEGWYEDSLIAVFSDHGESFGEHGHHYHHYLLYSWLLSVPFALHAPGLEPGPFQGPVQLTDLTPTVLQFLGIQPTRPLRGLPLLGADPPADRAMFGEEVSINGGLLRAFREQPLASEADVLARMRRIEHGLGYVSKLAVARSGFQLLQHRDSGAVELYDLRRDPRAEHDLADSEPARVAALRASLTDLRRDMLLRPLCELARTP